MPATLVGVFPDYLSPVANLLGAATSESNVDILVDSPDHGSLANFKLHHDAWEAAKAAKTKGAEVRLLTPAKLPTISRANPNYNDGQKYPGLKDTPGFKEFSRALPGIPEPATSDESELYIYEYMKNLLWEFLDCGARVALFSKGPEDEFRVFMWRVDDRAIYVSVPPTGPAEARLASDSAEVQVLVDMFERRWNSATEVKKDTLNATLLPPRRGYRGHS